MAAQQPSPDYAQAAPVPYLQRTPAEHVKAQGGEPFDLITKQGMSADQAFGSDAQPSPYAESLSKLLLATNFIGPGPKMPMHTMAPGSKPLGATKVYYHANPNGIVDKFDLAKVGSENDIGHVAHGVYLSEDKGHADFYARRGNNPGYVGSYALDIKNPFIVQSAGIESAFDKAAHNALIARGKEIDPRVNLAPDGYLNRNNPGLTPSEWTESLKKAGYDSVMLRFGLDKSNPTRSDEVVVFDPNNIRRIKQD